MLVYRNLFAKSGRSDFDTKAAAVNVFIQAFIFGFFNSVRVRRGLDLEHL